MTREAVTIHPNYLSKRGNLLYSLNEAEVKLTFLKGFLARYQPRIIQLQGVLAGISADVIEKKDLTQGFFGEFNAALSIDYLVAFQITRNIEYFKRSIAYLDKAILENCQTARDLLLQVLELNQDPILQQDPELKFWFEERLRHSQVRDVREELQCHQSSKRVIIPEESLRSAHSPFHITVGSSARGLSTYESIGEDGEPIYWFKHSIPNPSEEQQRYFGEDLQYYQNLAVQLEVFAGKFLQALIGLNQPDTAMSVNAAGYYYSLSQILPHQAGHSHLDRGYEPGLLHAARAMWPKRIIEDDDAHGQNLIRTPAGVSAIDTNYCFARYAAVFRGFENDAKEVTIPAAKKKEALPDRYDPDLQVLIHQDANDPWQRTYHLGKTEGYMGCDTAWDFENFPLTRHALPKNGLFHSQIGVSQHWHAREFRKNHDFKCEQYTTECKFLIMPRSLEAALADSVFDRFNEHAREVRHQLLSDLQRKRIQHIKMLKKSGAFKEFLQGHKSDLAYAIIFEFKAYCEDHKRLLNDNFSEAQLLYDAIQHYLFLLKELGIEIPSYLAGDLREFQDSLCSNNLDKLRHCETRLRNTVIPFYAKTGMKLEEDSAQAYMNTLQIKRDQRQIAENLKHQCYATAVRLSEELKTQRARVEENIATVDYQKTQEHQQILSGMLAACNRPNQIDWAQYGEALKQAEDYLEYFHVAEGLAQVYKFYKEELKQNTDTFKVSMFSRVLPFMAEQIYELISRPSEEGKANAQNLVDFCAHILNLQQNPLFDNLRIRANRFFGLKQQGSIADGTTGFRRWREAGLGNTMRSEALIKTVNATTEHNNTKITLGGKTFHDRKSLMSFFSQARTSSKNIFNEELIREARVTAAPAA